MVGDGALQDPHQAGPAFVVVNWPEDTTGLDGHLPHPQLEALQALDLASQVDRAEELYGDTPRLGCHAFVAHRAPSTGCSPPRRRDLVNLAPILICRRWCVL